MVMRVRSGADPQTEYVWELDPKHSNALVRFKMLQGGEVLDEITASDFEVQDGVALPRNAREVDRWLRHGKIVVVQTGTLSAIRCLLGSPDNVPALYHIEYPAGALVTDMRLKVPMRAATTRAFSDRDVYLAAVARDSRSRPIPAQTKLTRWWILGGIVLGCMCAWYGLRRLRRAKRADVPG